MSEKSVRLDKWLWAARFFKTRAIAKTAIETGKVHYDGQRPKPSRTVELGKAIRLRAGSVEKTIIVEQINDKRLGAPLAQAMYQETEDSIIKRELETQLRKDMNSSKLSPEKRPDKKQRRTLIKLKDNQG